MLYVFLLALSGVKFDLFFIEHYLDADKLGQLGPSLGMKKSSSLESLQTMVQEVRKKN